MAKYIELECAVCGSHFSRLLKTHKRALKNSKDGTYRPLCSRACKKKLSSKRQNIPCDNCGIIFEKKCSEIIRNEHHFCCQSCAAQFQNAQRKLTEPTNQVNCKECGKTFYVKDGSSKKSCDACCKEKKDEARGRAKKTLQKSVCCVCGRDFEYLTEDKKNKKKTCSQECFSVRMSLNAINRTQNDTSRLKSIVCEYSFQKKIITCASKAEYSCLNYIEEHYDVLDMDRCPLVLEYELDGKTRRYSPDFTVILKDGKTMIVECKTPLSNKDLQRKWDIYYRSIPMKQEALEKYCDVNGHLFLWYHKDMNLKFYNSISKKTLINTSR